MERNTRELASRQTGSGEYECQRISADDSMRGPFNVRVVEGKGSELADVLPAEKLVEAQSGERASPRKRCDSGGTSGSQPGSPLKAMSPPGSLREKPEPIVIFIVT
jgi:hypothetical protein